MYRLFSDTRELLYVGSTTDLRTRIDAHGRDQSWWAEVADCSVEFHPTADAMDVAEQTAIRDEHPRYNVVIRQVPTPMKRRSPKIAGPVKLDLVSANALALALDVDRTTVWRWEQAGRITPAVRTPGGHTRWDVDEVRAQLRGEAVSA